MRDLSLRLRFFVGRWCGCQTIGQLYGDLRGTNPNCMRIAEYTADVHDKRAFVGAADNVFVGKVETSDGQHVEGKDIYSLFTVRVLKNLKGQLLGQVTVSQVGSNLNGRECFQNSDEILSTGMTYLFVSCGARLTAVQCVRIGVAC